VDEGARLVPVALATRAVAVLLRLIGYRRTSALLAVVGSRRRAPACDAASSWARADELGRRVAAAAARGPLPVGCLPRALVLGTILSRRGIESVVRIGVRREDGTLRAHAWVEHAGVPVAEPPEIIARFAPFERDFRVALPR
jgi:hypothetical protein